MSWSTLSLEVIHNILIQLTISDIAHYIRTSKYATTLRDDTYFWLKKLDYDLQCVTHNGTLLIPSHYVNKYRHPKIPHPGYNIYKEWSVLTKCTNNNDYLNDYLNEYLSIGNNYLNKYLCDTIYDCIDNDDIIIFLLDKIDNIQHDCAIQICDLAIMYGSINVLEKLETLTKIEFNETYAMKAGEYGHLHILEWLDTREILFDSVYLDIIIENGHLHILIWLYEQKYIHELTSQHANIAAQENYINILDWLESQGILPDINAVTISGEYGALQSLIWLAQRGILPNQITVDNAAKNGHIPVLEWLQTTYNMSPGPNTPDIVAQRFNIIMLEWLSLRNLLPSYISADYAAQYGKIDVLLWLDQRGIYPTVIGANYAAKYGYLHIIKHLAQRHIYPDETGIKEATHYNKIYVLEFLRTQCRDEPCTIKTQQCNNVNLHANSQYEQFNPNDPNKVLNPESGRWISIHAAKYKELIKRGVIISRNT